MLRVVDIASHQAGINPAALDCDAVIVKATGGTTYTNGYPNEPNDNWREWADATLASGKKLGLYHYAMEYGAYNTAYAEARHFLDTISDYIGRAALFLDFEADAQGLPVSWAREWLDAVASETGSTPFFYAYAAYLNSRDHSEIAHYPLWMASYLNRYSGGGWVADPDNTWPTSSWGGMTMYQYTSTGRIGGYDDDLDLSVFYGDGADWDAIVGGGASGGTSAQDLINVAYSYLGTTEDDPRFFELIDYYNEHTDGYDMQYWDEWCACFVSVCSLKSGNTEYTGTSVNCATFRSIWQEKGIYRDADSTPAAGWLIDYDWQQDGIPDHIGIVVGCDGSTIHVIEGNAAGEVCAERWIPVNDPSISCFAAPNYPRKTRGDDEPMQFIYRPDGLNELRYHDGTKNVRLSNADQPEAINMVYKRCTGRDIPCFELGTPDARWGARFEQCFPMVTASNEWGGTAR